MSSNDNAVSCPLFCLRGHQWLACAIVALLTLSPLWPLVLTNTDDMVYSQLGYTHDWDSPYTNAVGMGRFYYLYSGYLYMCPYLVHSFWYFKLFAVGPLLAIPVLLGLILRKVFRSTDVLLMTMLYYLVLLQHYTDYYPTAAFPFVFTFSITLFLASLWSWLHYWQTRHSGLKWLSRSLFFFAILPYETFVYLFPVIYLVATISLARRDKSCHWLVAIRESVSLLRGHIAIVLIYLVAYVTFAVMVPTPEGFSRDHFATEGVDWKATWRTAWHFSTSALPLVSHGYSTTRYLTALYCRDPESYRGLCDVFRTADVSWWVRSLLAAGLVTSLLVRLKSFPLPTQLAVSGIGLFVFTSSPLAHAAVAKYQALVTAGVHVYLPTFFAYLGFVTFLIPFLLYLNGILQRRRSIYCAWLFAVSAGTAVVSMVHDFDNHHIARYQAHHAFSWQVMDKVLDTPTFRDLPDDARVYVPGLPRAEIVYDMVRNTRGDYWEDYVRQFSGKRVKLLYQLDFACPDARPPEYFLGVYKLPKELDAFVVLAPVNRVSEEGRLLANQFELMTYSKYKKCILSFSVGAGQRQHLDIHGRHTQGTLRQSIEVPIDRGDRPEALVQTHVSAGDIDLSTIDVSYFYDRP